MRKPEFLHVRHIELAAFLIDVANGVRADIAEVRRIGQFTDSRAVKYDQNGSFLHTVTSLLNLYI